jgi:hypothetical protein
LVVIYPVIELNDLVYAHRYGWLDALTRVTEGVMLRPEAALGPIFRSGATIKGYLRARYGLPQEPLDRLKIMLDHGINGAGFREAFGLDKTPESLVKVYSRLGVDMGLAFDVPARLYVSSIVDIVMDGSTDVNVDGSVRDVIVRAAEIVKGRLRGDRRKAMSIIMDNPSVRRLLRELSEVSVEETVKRLKEMVGHAQRLGFKGLVPVVQGLFKDDIERCIRETVEVMAQYSNEFTVAIGTGGRALSREDVDNIRFAIAKVKEHAAKSNVSVRIHLLGWSSPNRLWDAEVLKDVYSADSLTVRRRAVEGRVFVIKGNSIGLVHVSRLRDINCGCPACSDPMLRRYVLDPSGARRSDVRMVHNIYTITRFLNEISERAWGTAIRGYGLWRA